MNVLNLYAGIGGNRKLWTNCNVTAVELDKNIAKAYQELFPNDNVIYDDAHEFLLKNYNKFDFIWSSPPCPTHSRANNSLKGYGIVRYPDMSLWQEIVLMRHHVTAFMVIENVIPYYFPLYAPTIEIDRHYFWSNFSIDGKNVPRSFNQSKATKEQLSEYHSIPIPDTKDSRKVLRNAVNPEIGLHIMNAVLRIKNNSIF